MIQRFMSSRRALAFAGVASLMAVLVGCQPAKAPESPVRAVRTLVISETGGTLDREFSGDIRARTETRLSFRVPGKITARQVELGQSVRPGQTLAQLDATDLRLNQQAAQAGLAAAEATAVQAAADLKRFQDLRAQGFISAAELDRHQTNNKNAQAQLTQARAQSSVQGNQAAYGTLTAGAAGVITSVDAEPGQVVAAGQPVVTLAHDGPRDVVFSVPEDMGPTVRPLVGKGGALKVRRWGSEQWVPATIREMAAATDPTTRTFLVKADVNRLDAALGQTATVALAVPSRLQGGGVHLPLNALVEQGGKSAVWILDPKAMTVSRQLVITAEVNGNIVLVASGLRPGQEVVTAGVHVLTQGQKVRRLQVSASAAAANSH
jgi:membrane fusion protein, multidrug efflux system